jgi:hypothetical protein
LIQNPPSSKILAQAGASVFDGFGLIRRYSGSQESWNNLRQRKLRSTDKNEMKNIRRNSIPGSA